MKINIKNNLFIVMLFTFLIPACTNGVEINNKKQFDLGGISEKRKKVCIDLLEKRESIPTNIIINRLEYVADTFMIKNFSEVRVRYNRLLKLSDSFQQFVDQELLNDPKFKSCYNYDEFLNHYQSFKGLFSNSSSNIRNGLRQLEAWHWGIEYSKGSQMGRFYPFSACKTVKYDSSLLKSLNVAGDSFLQYYKRLIVNLGMRPNLPSLDHFHNYILMSYKTGPNKRNKYLLFEEGRFRNYEMLDLVEPEEIHIKSSWSDSLAGINNFSTITIEDRPKIADPVDIFFEGGVKALKKHFKKNIKENTISRLPKSPYAGFNISTNGTISDIKIFTEYKIDEKKKSEYIRILRKTSGRWLPLSLNGSRQGHYMRFPLELYIYQMDK